MVKHSPLDLALHLITALSFVKHNASIALVVEESRYRLLLVLTTSFHPHPSSRTRNPHQPPLRHVARRLYAGRVKHDSESGAESLRREVGAERCTDDAVVAFGYPVSTPSHTLILLLSLYRVSS